jgi:UDP-N-acetyl-D-mannosaminuronic acid transferase (WecB/TagA/CpsF family)
LKKQCTFPQKSPIHQTKSRVQGFPISKAVCEKMTLKHGEIWLCGQSKCLYQNALVEWSCVRQKFVHDFVAAFAKVMNLDRFDVA